MEVKDLEAKITSAADVLPVIIDEVINATLAYCSEAEGQILFRIFNENLGAKGESFGVYKSEAYKEFRAALGRETSKKDLQLTDQMRLTIYTDYEKKALMLSTALDTKTPELRVGYAIKNGAKKVKTPKAISHAEKARHQEEQLGFKIFEPSDQERKAAMEFAQDAFLESINKILGN